MKKLLPLLLLFFGTFSHAFSSDELPHYVLHDLQGTPQPLTQWKGKILILNFWATWCPPCRREIPAFIELQQEYGNQGVQFVGISIDDPDNVTHYAEDHNINYPLLNGERTGIKLSAVLGNQSTALPYTAVFDRNGKIIARYRGEVHRQEIVSTITPLLQ